MFPKDQNNVLKCLILSTTQRNSVYLNKQGNVHIKKLLKRKINKCVWHQVINHFKISDRMYLNSVVLWLLFFFCTDDTTKMELIRFNNLFRSRQKWIIGYQTNADFLVWWFYIPKAATSVELLAEDANATEAYWTGESYRWRTAFLLYCNLSLFRASSLRDALHSHLEANPSNRSVICQTKTRTERPRRLIRPQVNSMLM